MVTVGADVEVFGKRKDGHFVALCDKIGGTKEKPLQCEDLPKGFMVQEDNVSLEYNIPYAVTRADFIKKIGIMRKKCQELLENLGLDMAEDASVLFTKEELSHPKALVFGCEPDFNAWTKGQNPRPEPDDPSLRTAGGHIHVGTNEVDMVNGICAMDLFLGVPSVLLDTSPASIRRRQLYGKAGAMRPKPYGYEYRVLSNFWMFSDKLVGWVFDNTILSTRFNVQKITKAVSQQIQQCINNGDAELALSLIKTFNVPMPEDKVEGEVNVKGTLTPKNLKMYMDELVDVPTFVMPTMQFDTTTGQRTTNQARRTTMFNTTHWVTPTPRPAPVREEEEDNGF